jgi:hypothetical protein
MVLTEVVQDRFQDYYSRERHRNLLTISLEQPNPCQFINDKVSINIHFNAQKGGRREVTGLRPALIPQNRKKNTPV